MECKNCRNPLPDMAFYCENCGARVIRNRLTPKNLFHYAIETWFNIDNSFLKTFITLFTDPRDVIHGYITGLRKKYMNPISYMTIAITLSGLILILMQNYSGEIDMNLFNQNVDQEGFKNFSDKVMAFTTDYYSLLFLLYVPVFALAGFLTFNKNGYNLTEYLIVVIYAMAQYSLLSFPFSLIILLLDPVNYITWSIPFSVLMVVLLIYIIQIMNRFSWGAFLGRMLVFVMLTMIGYIGVIIFIYILLFATGTITLEDVKNINQATSSAINWASYNLV